jgi:16S rRNA (guanine1516-N2)-methyltransferase
MGYEVTFIERSPLMAALLADGLTRLAQEPWLRALSLPPPCLMVGDAIHLLATLPNPPDCIYLDPMFPPKRKKSALAKKAMQVLHDIIGQDSDKQTLFAAAWQAAGKRVVIKSPNDAEPLGGKPSLSFQSKLVRYDVYLKT